MAYERRALEKAIEEFDWLARTYGQEFGRDFNAWCNSIVENAPTNPDKLLLIPLSDVLGKAPTVVEYVWSQIRDQTTLDRWRSLLTLLQERKPPFELLAAHIKIFVQDRYFVNVTALVRINRVDQYVEFIHFSFWGDGC